MQNSQVIIKCLQGDVVGSASGLRIIAEIQRLMLLGVSCLSRDEFVCGCIGKHGVWVGEWVFDDGASSCLFAGLVFLLI